MAVGALPLTVGVTPMSPQGSNVTIWALPGTRQGGHGALLALEHHSFITPVSLAGVTCYNWLPFLLPHSVLQRFPHILHSCPPRALQILGTPWGPSCHAPERDLQGPRAARSVPVPLSQTSVPHQPALPFPDLSIWTEQELAVTWQHLRPRTLPLAPTWVWSLNSSRELCTCCKGAAE